MEFIKEDVYAAARILRCSYDELVKALKSQLKGGLSIIPLYQDDRIPEPETPSGPLCRLNKAGLEQFPRRDGNGRVVGIGRDDPNMLRVSWQIKKGWKNPELFHKDLVEVFDN